MHRLSIQYTNVKAASVENYGVFTKLTHQELKAHSHREKAEANAKNINGKKTKIKENFRFYCHFRSVWMDLKSSAGYESPLTCMLQIYMYVNLIC